MKFFAPLIFLGAILFSLPTLWMGRQRNQISLVTKAVCTSETQYILTLPL